MRTYYVYIMTNRSRTLYIGMTSDLRRRVHEHRVGRYPRAFTKKYDMFHLVYFETTHSWRAAFARERRLKGLLRRKKIALIESLNPRWLDLAAEWR